MKNQIALAGSDISYADKVKTKNKETAFMCWMAEPLYLWAKTFYSFIVSPHFSNPLTLNRH